MNPIIGDKPVIFEVFTTTEGESDAIQIMRTYLNDYKIIIKNKIIGTVRMVLGKNGIETVRKLLGKY